MDKQAKILSTESLERVETPEGGGWHNGHETLKVEITYRKGARVRGYYLALRTYRDLDNGSMLCDLFGHPSKYILLQETKAFSAKTLAGLTVDQAVLDAAIAEVKAAHTAYRAKQKAETEQYASV